MGQTRVGQYQQWLHYQEVDRRLRAELEVLENAITQLQEQILLLEQATPDADNVIIRALSVTLNGRSSAIDGMADKQNGNVALNQPIDANSSALFGWGGLPNLATQDIQGAAIDTSRPPIPHSDTALLPEDMATFLDEHAQTEPQLELPWWLRNIAMAANINGPRRTGPVDQETLRTNRLVQRWIERWGRKTPSQEKQPEGQSNE